MKQLFTLFLVLAWALTAGAKDYTDELEVLINGQGMKQPATISVEKQADGKYLLTLQNFMLANEDGTGGINYMPVGNIKIADVPGIEQNGATFLEAEQNIIIEPGNADISDKGGTWLGPIFGEVPVAVNAELRGEKLYAVIDINMAALNQIIQVTFGLGGYQIGNSGFEDFHDVALLSDKGETIVSGVEPDYWHSFITGSADLYNGQSAMAILQIACSMGSHAFQSNIVRPGSTGKSSLQLKSSFALIAIANGTITTGRLNAASASVSKDASSGQWLNHSWNDMSLPDLAPDNMPFYSEMNGRPDSIAAWVRFTPSKDNDEDTGYDNHPFASLNAVINDGTYYQDPEQTAAVSGDVRPTEYHNVVAKARNITIAEGDWKRVVVPFDYATYAADNAQPKAILVTASTNADAACGGKNDELLLDDMELIYNHSLTGLNIAGQEINIAEKNITIAVEPTEENTTVATNAAGARTNVSIDAEAKTIVVRVLAGDFKSSSTYTFNYTVDPTAITAAKADKPANAKRYNLAGQQVKGNAKGIVIEDGRKVIK